MRLNVVFAIGCLLACAAGMAQPNPTAEQTEPAHRANICSDDWITYAIWDVTGSKRNPIGKGESGECNPQVYGGKWQNYAQLRKAAVAYVARAAATPNPAQQETQLARNANYCEDPWITLAIRQTQAGARNPIGVGTFGECDPKLYNGGEWPNYAQLVHAVRTTLSMLSSQGVRFSLKDNGNNTVTIQTLVGQAFDRSVVTGGILANRYIPNAANANSQGMGDIVTLDGITHIDNDSGESGPKSRTMSTVKLPTGEVMMVGHF